MPTAQLSPPTLLLPGLSAPRSGALSAPWVHPLSRATLTAARPPDTPSPGAPLRWAAPARSQFARAPTHLLHRAAQPLPYQTVLPGARCPARHFEGNQLPGGSIGLSPLVPGPAIKLHVRTARDLHRRFPRLHPAQD